MLKNLERVHLTFINTYHCNSIVKATTVVRSREYNSKLSIRKKVITILYNLCEKRRKKDNITIYKFRNLFSEKETSTLCSRLACWALQMGSISFVLETQRPFQVQTCKRLHGGPFIHQTLTSLLDQIKSRADQRVEHQ